MFISEGSNKCWGLDNQQSRFLINRIIKNKIQRSGLFIIPRAPMSYNNLNKNKYSNKNILIKIS